LVSPLLSMADLAMAGKTAFIIDPGLF